MHHKSASCYALLQLSHAAWLETNFVNPLKLRNNATSFKVMLSYSGSCWLYPCRNDEIFISWFLSFARECYRITSCDCRTQCMACREHLLCWCSLICVRVTFLWWARQVNLWVEHDWEKLLKCCGWQWSKMKDILEIPAAVVNVFWFELLFTHLVIPILKSCTTIHIQLVNHFVAKQGQLSQLKLYQLLIRKSVGRRTWQSVL